jgi:hypothetical protein
MPDNIRHRQSIITEPSIEKQESLRQKLQKNPELIEFSELAMLHIAQSIRHNLELHPLHLASDGCNRVRAGCSYFFE